MVISNRQQAAGFTFVEMIVVSALLGMLIYSVSTLVESGGQSQEYARRLNRATEVSNEVVDKIRTEMVSSVRIFGNDTEGIENAGLWDVVGAPPVLPGSRLPTLGASQSIRPDTAGAEITGNTLFFARLAWVDRFQCTSGNTYLVDVYRWIIYYLTAEDGGPKPGRPIGLNIVRLESEPLVDGVAIDRITNATDQAEVLMHLHDATPDATGAVRSPCEVVWRRGALPSVAGTLRMIDESDGSLSNTPVGTRPNPWSILRSEAEVPNVLTYRHHSVATNYAAPTFGVGKYAVATTSGSGFPHGFEVQTVGPSNGRQTLLHLVVSSTNLRGHWAKSNVQVVVDSRDL